MENLKVALEKLSHSIQNLEDAVAFSVAQQNQHKEKIENLQTVIQTTYLRIDKALGEFSSSEENKGELCLSLP